MADYISTLTGVQMDAALIDMAEHNSEAYAVGERSGIPVVVGDVTYHNNARYYAQIASSQIVGDASSAVRWDTDQSEALTDAQKAQARKNIGAAAFNDNLLDNPWFTVRQRGNGPFSGANVTGIDRWKTTNSNSTVTGNDGYITFTAASGGNAFIVQYTDDDYEGTYTYSAYIRGSGAGYVAVTNADRSAVLSSKSFDNVGNTWTLVSGTFTTSNTAIGAFTIRVNAGTSIDIKCAKLELGSVSTLANDAKPNYAAELAKCQRYFWRLNFSSSTDPLAFGIPYSTTEARVLVHTPVPMRTAPTISVSSVGSLYLVGNGNAGQVVTNLSRGGFIGNGTILVATTSGTLMTRHIYAISVNGSGYIDFSAEP